MVFLIPQSLLVKPRKKPCPLLLSAPMLHLFHQVSCILCFVAFKGDYFIWILRVQTFSKIKEPLWLQKQAFILILLLHQLRGQGLGGWKIYTNDLK